MKKVGDFIKESVPNEYMTEFTRQLTNWDEGVTSQCFYDIDLLETMLRNAKEIFKQRIKHGQ